MVSRIATSLFVIAGAIGAIGCGQSADACPPLQLRAPDGTDYDLSGTWRGNDQGIYYVKQLGSCVWWSGMSDFTGQYPGEVWIMTFKGHVTETGRIDGDFVDVKSTNPGSGTLAIEVRPDLKMYKVDQTGHPVGVSTWERTDDAPAQPPTFIPPGASPN